MSVSRIYSKVSLEVWGDAKFCALSPMRPSGQSLWLYLLTGKFRTAIPGLILNAGLGALADRLAWPVRDVKKHWQEIEALGMAAADWRAGVIWVPKAIEHNEPESPNVIRGWGKLVLPECALVAAALAQLRGYISAHLTEGFREAFDEAFAKAFRQPSANQEQDLFQEQEHDPPPNPPVGGFAQPSTRKPTKAEEEWAENVLRALGGCKHPAPGCRSHGECIGRLVMERRLRVQTGMDSTLAERRA
jgi:AraC-like DNA-binding protein